MKFSIVFLFMFPAVMAFAQYKNDWEREKLRGKVKSVTTTWNYRYKEKDVWRNWEFSDGTAKTYNVAGQILKDETMDGSQKTKWIITYKYNADKKGFIVSTTNKEGKTWKSAAWKTDVNGRRTEEIQFNADTIRRTYKYTYDEKGYWVEYSGFNADGSITSRTFYTNDLKGRMIENKYTVPKYAPSFQMYEYDEKDNIVVEKWPGGNGLHSFRFERTYDDKNNMIKEIKYIDGKPKAYETTFIYDYDTKGNWIKKTEYTADGEPYSIKERKIIYY